MATVKSYKRNGAELNVEPSDLDETLRIAADCLRQTKGTVAVYPNTEEGRQMFLNRSAEYFEHIRTVNASLDAEQKPLIADVESYCNWMHIVRQTLLNYEKRSQQWKEMIDLVRQGITSSKKQLLLSGKMPPVVGIFDLCNNNSADYQTVSAIHVSTEPVERRTPQLSVDEIDAIAQDEPPMLPKGE